MNDAHKIFKLYSESKNEPDVREDENGNKRWMLHGKCHREDGPAIEYADGSKAWHMNGKLHRINGPAIERANGGKSWHVNGLLHRIDGAAVEFANGTKQWHVDGEQFYDIDDWARAALQYEGEEPTQESIDDKIAQVMQQDLFD